MDVVTAFLASFHSLSIGLAEIELILTSRNGTWFDLSQSLQFLTATASSRLSKNLALTYLVHRITSAIVTVEEMGTFH